MSFTCKDCGDSTCAQWGSHDAACEEFTSEVQVETVPESEPVANHRLVVECPQHGQVIVRLDRLEDLVSRMRREVMKEDQ